MAVAVPSISATASQTSAPHKCSGKHMTRLFVGEGNFSFTEAFIQKHLKAHPNIAISIIATELLTEEQYMAIGRIVPIMEKDEIEFVHEGEKETLERIEKLKKLGVRVLLGFDATKTHEHPIIQEKKRIPRIHWNLPLNDQPKGNFRKLLTQFFRSCSLVQKDGDRVYITLLQGANKISPITANMAGDWIFQQGYKASIALASSLSGYKLIKKRPFIQDGNLRYPGYITRNSFNGKPLTAEQMKCVREFIFEKQQTALQLEKGITIGGVAKALQKYTDSSIEKITVNFWSIKCKEDDKPVEVFYYECNTDDESSGCSDSEEQGAKTSQAPPKHKSSVKK